jgi:YgiT-type zinc finger domain-containing protein
LPTPQAQHRDKILYQKEKTGTATMTGSTPSENENSYICPECKSGVMSLRYITYYTWLNKELITVPNFPAWVCDLCGRREYDARAISWLNTLLNPSAGTHPAKRRKRGPQPPAVDRPQP